MLNIVHISTICVSSVTNSLVITDETQMVEICIKSNSITRKVVLMKPIYGISLAFLLMIGLCSRLLFRPFCSPNFSFLSFKVAVIAKCTPMLLYWSLALLIFGFLVLYAVAFVSHMQLSNF